MRLIDADALRKAIEDDAESVGPGYGSRWHFIHTINNAPTIDAVPVVRCKDCKHSRNDELWHMRWCKGVTVKDEHFCADGERRDDED